MRPNFDRSLELLCSTCGGTSFEYEAETGPFRCVGCDRTFEREELLRENGLIVEGGVEEIASDAAKYARDAFRKSIRKAISGSKNFKLK